MRFRARKDVTHNTITEGLRQHGIVVFDTHQLGNGFPDALTWQSTTGYQIVAEQLEDMAGITNRERNTLLTAAGLLKQIASAGRWLPMEFKSDNTISHQKKDARLKPKQEAAQQLAPIPIVGSLEDALRLHGIRVVA